MPVKYSKVTPNRQTTKKIEVRDFILIFFLIPQPHFQGIYIWVITSPTYIFPGVLLADTVCRDAFLNYSEKGEGRAKRLTIWLLQAERNCQGVVQKLTF